MNTTTTPRAGDWLELKGLPGYQSRTGQITEVIGSGEHTHYRVRWDEQHESIVYPADGAIHIRRERPPHRHR